MITGPPGNPPLPPPNPGPTGPGRVALHRTYPPGTPQPQPGPGQPPQPPPRGYTSAPFGQTGGRYGYGGTA